MRPQFDLQSPEINQNPYPLFARLRREQPISFGRSFLGPAFMVARYADVKEILEDNERFVSDPRTLGGDPHERWWMPSIMQAFRDNLVSADDPQHKRLRTLVHKAFTPRRIELLAQNVSDWTDRLLNDAQRKKHFDLVADFALPLPLNIISDMMGVPADDRHGFHAYTKSFLDGSMSNPLSVVNKLSSTVKMMKLFKKLIQLRQREPADDLITALVQAEEKGDSLNESELVAMIFVLLLAGHETTVNLIASGMLALLEHPAQLRRLRDEPDLIDTAVEELLRFTNPVEHPGPRYTREDIEMHGVKMPRKSLVVPLIASANRDDAQFPNGDALDVGRTPNKHLSFGMGIHYCLGAPLARLEGRIAILELLKRLPDLKLARQPEELKWRSSIAVRGLHALPVSVAA